MTAALHLALLVGLIVLSAVVILVIIALPSLYRNQSADDQAGFVSEVTDGSI